MNFPEMIGVPPCRETLDHILDRMAAYHVTHGCAPVKIKLPMLTAYSICKGTRDEIGDAVVPLFFNGIKAFTPECAETLRIYGMQVELVHDKDADLILE